MNRQDPNKLVPRLYPREPRHLQGRRRPRRRLRNRYALATPVPLLDTHVSLLALSLETGILSMFAAKSGAKKVYAVDASAVAFKAERNIKDNGLSEIIT